MSAVGKVPLQVPRVRDRSVTSDDNKIKFRSSLVPPYLRKAKSVEALAALPGQDAEGLSSSTTTRLKTAWWDE